ncbi:three-helix bundle dimerization domain-containing protein, partial [Nocardia cyriacigeorgica]
MELDTVREEKAIRDLENRLVDSLPEATPEQVGSAVQNAHQRFDGLPIRDFVPILV